MNLIQAVPDKEKADAKTEKSQEQQQAPSASSYPVQSQATTDETNRADNVEERSDQKQQVAAKRRKRRRRRIRLTEKRLAVWLPVIISALVLLVTCVSIFYAYRQWQTMERQGQIMQETLRMSERAYVAVHDIQTDLTLGTATILLENKGRLPAKNIRVSTVQYLWLGESKEAAIEDRKEFDWGAQGELFPGNYKIPIVLFLDARVQSPDNNCILGGIILYNDGFGNEAMSAFAFSYRPKPFNQWVMVRLKDAPPDFVPPTKPNQ